MSPRSKDGSGHATVRRRKATPPKERSGQASMSAIGPNSDQPELRFIRNAAAPGKIDDGSGPAPKRRTIIKNHSKTSIYITTISAVSLDRRVNLLNPLAFTRYVFVKTSVSVPLPAQRLPRLPRGLYRRLTANPVGC